MSTNQTVAIPNNSLEYLSKFLVLISLEIPSIIISLSIFIYFAYYRTTRLTYQNYSILTLLIFNFLQVVTDLPMPMSFYHNGIVQPATSAYCIWWAWYEYSLNIVNCSIMGWISIERYIFIFHDTFIRNLISWKRRLLHIVPLVFCSTWAPLYYAVAIIISPMCTTIMYYDTLGCGLPCYLSTNWGVVDLFLNTTLPVCTILIFNILLFSRVIYQNLTIIGRMHNNWRRHRKMGLQLGIISSLYLVVWIPVVVTQLGEIYIDPTFLLQQSDTFYFLIYIIPLILPMIYLMSMPEVIKKFKSLIFRQRPTTIIPLNSTFMQQSNLRHRSRINVVSKC